jgi:hypothetical protein
MSRLDIVATAVKNGAHSFNYIRKATGLKFTDAQFLELIKENEDRLQLTSIRRKDADGKRVQPGWPGVKLRVAVAL